MNTIFLDFETHYDAEYSLNKMTPAEFILDRRFETICVAAQVDDGPIEVEVIDGPGFATWLKQFDPAKTITATYNSLFDNSILAWRYGFVPARMIDVLGMARALLGHELKSLSLAKVSEFLGTGQKGDALINVKGMRREQIKAAGLWQSFTDYAKQDVVLLRGNFNVLAPKFPKSEFRVVDLVLRCAIEPRFRIDTPLLTQHLADIRANKKKLITSCAADKSFLMSNLKFAELLRAEGVEPGTKISLLTKRETFAFAKTDEFMGGLLEHENPKVQALAAARLGIKSTIEETRCERLLTVAQLDWKGLPANSTPIALRYSGAHTHRLSGDWKMNMQNMPRGSKLRESLKAPPGYKVISADLGQIEARLTAWLCKADVLLRAFEDGLDPYALMAERIFEVACTPSANPDYDFHRFIGKQAVLGLGFGAGAPKFYTMVIRVARAMGMDVKKILKVWTPGLAEKATSAYRSTNWPIQDFWRKLQSILDNCWSINGNSTKVGPVKISYGCVEGPGGLCMLYKPIRTKEGLAYEYGGKVYHIYGAKFLENIIQFLARIIVMHAALRIADRGYKFALQAHDELVFIAPEAEVSAASAVIKEEMTRRPSWAPTLPLKVSIGVGDNYGECK